MTLTSFLEMRSLVVQASLKVMFFCQTPNVRLQAHTAIYARPLWTIFNLSLQSSSFFSISQTYSVHKANQYTISPETT